MSEQIFSGRAASPTAPAERLAPITPDDAADLPDGLTRGIFVGEAGVVSVLGAAGSRVDVVSAASQYHPLRIRRVFADRTTAGALIALY